MDTEKVLSLYGSGADVLRTHHSEFPGGRDERYCFETQYPSRRLAVKAHRNAYTNPERVAGWARLIGHYNALGIYCPAIVPDMSGRSVSEQQGFTVWAEEYFSGRVLRDKLDNTALLPPEHVLHDMFGTIGILAANPAPLLPFPGAYCMYDKFSPEDVSDECCLYAEALVPVYEEHAPRLAHRAGELVSRWYALRREFEAEYRALPEASFQSDLSYDNVIVTDDGRFGGLVDFNLCGTDKIINYALCQCDYLAMEASDDELNRAIERVLRLDANELSRVDERTARHLSLITAHYRFTDAEKRAFNRLYNVAMPFRATYWSCYMENLLGNADEFAEVVLRHIEYSMTRSDVDIMLP